MTFVMSLIVAGRAIAPRTSDNIRVSKALLEFVFFDGMEK